MKPTNNLVYRAVEDFEDHKVIRVKEMSGKSGHLHTYKLHEYVRSDIVETIIEELARLSVDNRYDKSINSGGLSHTQEIQVERKRILIHYGLDT